MKETQAIKSFDREHILKLVNKQQWIQLINEFKDNEKYDNICSDPILKPIIDQYLLNELLNNTAFVNDPAYKYYLEQFSQLHESPTFNFKLSENDYRNLTVKIVEIEQSLDFAYKYAIKFPEEPKCKEVIAEFQKKLPKFIQHSQEKEIFVTENKDVGKIDARISLFKSQQEYQFYRAIIEVYPNFLVIPNVALSAVLNFDLVKNNLSNEERSYFFQALIDNKHLRSMTTYSMKKD